MPTDDTLKIEKSMEDFFKTSDSLFNHRKKTRAATQILFPVIDKPKVSKKTPVMIEHAQLSESYISPVHTRRRMKHMEPPKSFHPTPPSFDWCLFSASFLIGIGPLIYLIYFAIQYQHYKKNIRLTHPVKIQR